MYLQNSLVYFLLLFAKDLDHLFGKLAYGSIFLTLDHVVVSQDEMALVELTQAESARSGVVGTVILYTNANDWLSGMAWCSFAVLGGHLKYFDAMLLVYGI